MTLFTLQKYLQAAGFDNRRTIRENISKGLFKVNKQIIRDPNYAVNPDVDTVFFKNSKLDLKIEKKVYFIFNKPDGVVSTLKDPQKRPAISDFIKNIRERVYPVGRLDYHSEGLILLTNDGDLMNHIISPKNKIPKVYVIKIKGSLSNETMKKLTSKGFFLDGRRILPFKIDFIKKTQQNNSWLRVTIVEGKKHIVRKIFKYSGHPVEKLKRSAIGNISLREVPPGHWRELTNEEVRTFKKRYNFTESKKSEK